MHPRQTDELRQVTQLLGQGRQALLLRYWPGEQLDAHMLPVVFVEPLLLVFVLVMKKVGWHWLQLARDVQKRQLLLQDAHNSTPPLVEVDGK